MIAVATAECALLVMCVCFLFDAADFGLLVFAGQFDNSFWWLELGAELATGEKSAEHSTVLWVLHVSTGGSAVKSCKLSLCPSPSLPLGTCNLC